MQLHKKTTAPALARRHAAPLTQPVTFRPRGKACRAIVNFDAKESDIYRRTVADPKFWAKHRSIERYWNNVLNMPSSRIIRSLCNPLGYIIGLGTILCSYETAIESGVLPSDWPTFLMPSEQPQMMTSFAIALLLVFRTNQSYSRWWEARKIWGGILNRVRDISMQCVLFFPEEQHELRQALGRWTIAFARSLHAHLQEGVDLRESLQGQLRPEEMDMLFESKHRVVKSVSVLAEIINEAKLNPIQSQMMQHNVQFFYDMLGMCERIYKTPLPLTYTRHSSRFLTIWLTFMPFAGWTTYGWSILPITFVVGMLLLGIDEIGVQMEEPFCVLPLDAICQSAEASVAQVLGERDKTKAYAKSLYVPPTGNGVNGATSHHALDADTLDQLLITK